MFRSRRLIWPVILLCLLFTMEAASAATGREWQIRYPTPAPAELFDVTYGGGRYVAVGGLGTIISSADGRKWLAHPTGTSGTFARVAWENGRFVAIGAAGEQLQQGMIYTSVDGQRWERLAGSHPLLTSLAAGNGRFVAFGRREDRNPPEEALLVSEDGLTWTEIPRSAFANSLPDRVIFGGGQFMAGDQRVVYVSTDGLTWEIAARDLPWGFRPIAHAGNLYLGELYDGVVTSPDGVSWTKVTGLQEPARMAYGNGRYAIAGRGLFLSTDGQTWTRHKVGKYADDGIRRLVFGGGRFVGVGWGGLIMTSPDGLNWSTVAPSGQAFITSFAYGNGAWVGVESLAGVVTSADGLRWSRQPLEGVSAVAFGAGRFVAVSWGALLSSADGTTWTEQLKERRTFGSVLWDGRRFLVLDATSTLFTSPDGLQWSTLPVEAPTGFYRSMVYAGGLYVAVVDLVQGNRLGGSAILTSPDAVTWTQVPGALSEDRLKRVAYGNGLYMAVGNAGLVLLSSDGVVWQRTALPEPVYANALLFDGRQFLVTSLGRLFTSAAGRTWQTEPASDQGTALAFADGLLLMGGERIQTATVRAEASCRGRFPDLKATDPACAPVELLAERGVVSGMPDGSFLPEGAVTRAAFARLLVAALGKEPTAGGPSPFADTAGHWAEGWIRQAAALGLIGGYADGTFRPDEPVTRAQVFKMAAAALGLKPGGQAPYVDAAPEEWYAPWAASAVAARLMGARAPYPVWQSRFLEAERNATRAEAALVLANLLSKR